MSEAELRRMIEMASDYAEKRMAKKGEVRPIWHAVRADGRHVVLPAPPTDDKDLGALIMREVFKHGDVAACLFIDEAWTADATGDADTARLTAWLDAHDWSLEGYPDRIECVIFHGEDRDGRMVTAQRRIDRSGGRPKLGPLRFDDMTGVQSEGRLIGMLPPRRDAKVQ
jgi:hypothetical protein